MTSDADVKTFTAPTMQEALDLVRRELGTDAVILHTREIAARGIFPWSRTPKKVEITAGLGVSVSTPPALLRAKERERTRALADAVRNLDGSTSGVPRAATPVVAAAYQSTTARSPSKSTSHGSSKSSQSPTAAVAPAARSPQSNPQRAPASPAAPQPTPRWSALPRTAPEHYGIPLDGPAPGSSTGPVSSPAPVPTRVPTASRPVPAPPPQPIAPPSRPETAHAAHVGVPGGPHFAVGTPGQVGGIHSVSPRVVGAPAPWEQQLASIQRLVEQLMRKTMLGEGDMPRELLQLYTQLLDSDVSEEVAHELICGVRQQSGNAPLTDAEAYQKLRQAIESSIRCSGPLKLTARQRRVVALVGPTGVGKTTTIAKLAANYRLRDGVRMGLVTVDTYRIAAVEQLRTYAEIIDLPMRVVTSPLEMAKSLDELMGLDLILIDTAGRSPRDEVKIQELRDLFAEAHVDEVHLVLSATSSPKSLESTAEQFAAAGTTALVLTKLDEVSHPGALLNVTRRIPLPLSYLTTGQDVPDDIEPATAQRLARLILGEERVVKSPAPVHASGELMEAAA